MQRERQANRVDANSANWRELALISVKVLLFGSLFGATSASAIDTIIRDLAIRPATSNYTDSGTLRFPWKHVYSDGLYDHGERITNYHAPAVTAGAGWVILSNVVAATYFPQVDSINTNGTLLTYTTSTQGLFRIEFADTFNNTNTGTSAFDGRYLVGLKWTDPHGHLNTVRLFDMPQNVSTSDYNWGANGNDSFWYGNTYYLHCGAGQTITITNNVIIDWFAGDYNGWNYLNLTLSTTP